MEDQKVQTPSVVDQLGQQENLPDLDEITTTDYLPKLPAVASPVLTESQTASRLGLFALNWQKLTKAKFAENIGLQDSLCYTSSSVESTKDNCTKGARAPSAGGHSNSFGQGSYPRGSSSPTAVCVDSFSSPQQIFPEGEISDGRVTNSSLSSPFSGLYDEIRFKGRLLCHTSPRRLAEVPEVCFRGVDVRVPVFTIRPFLSSQDLHQVDAPDGSSTSLRGTVIYLDDLLIIHQREKTLRVIFHYVVDLLTNLGFIVKPEKCSPAPTQRLIFFRVFDYLSTTRETSNNIPVSRSIYTAVHCLQTPLHRLSLVCKSAIHRNHLKSVGFQTISIVQLVHSLHCC